MSEFTIIDKARLYLLYALSPLAPPVLKDPTLRVILIRHGEKPDEGDNLTCAGLNRALALPAVLNRLMPTPPNRTYVPLIGTDGKKTTSVRMFQTVTPYAVQHNLVLNSDYATDNIEGITQDIRQRRGTVLLVWEHNSIVEIANKLGIKEVEDWPDTDFDSIWTITFSGGGRKGKAKHPSLAKTRQHIRPSATCPA
ncbi:histidine phosphatase family protein [Hymenobacter arcticus]